MGLGHYEESIHLARSTREDKWTRASFCIFDCLDMKNQPFEERYKFLNTLQLPKHISIVKQIPCKSNEHLDEFLAQVRDKGSENDVCFVNSIRWRRSYDKATRFAL